MIALVFANAMQTLRDTLRGPTLEQQLQMRGITVIDLKKVRTYQQRQVHAGQFGSHWYRVPYEKFDRLAPPQRVLGNVRKARTIPGVEVYAEAFQDDPFYFAERGNQICCIDFDKAPGFEP